MYGQPGGDRARHALQTTGIDGAVRPRQNPPPPGVLVPGLPYTPTEAQRVRIPFGLTPEERKQWIQDDLEAIFRAKGAPRRVAYAYEEARSRQIRRR